MTITFLDIDGVLNSEDYAIYRYVFKETDSDEFFDKRAIAFLNLLIEETDTKIVLSSSWRSDLEEVKKRMTDNGFKYDIFDITPYRESRIRGEEIQDWIDEYEKTHEPLESYVILDDDCDILPEQNDNFVQCDFMNGLTCKEVYKAENILTKIV